MLKKLKSIFKAALGIALLRQIYEQSTLLLLRIFASNRVFASLYGWVGFMTFNREQVAVLHGRLDYYKNLKKYRMSHVELRRNIHRLEKGLVMQPRRLMFAKNYIAETIEFYEKAIEQVQRGEPSIDQSEVDWAHDVLKQYFSVVHDNDKAIRNAKIKFQHLLKEYSHEEENKKVPFLRKNTVKNQVSYEGLLALSKQRRSVRWYKQKKVPRDLIDKALTVAREAPTACNRMPYEFKIFDDPVMVKQISRIPFGTAGYSHQIPTIIVVVGKLNSYFSPRDRHAIYIDASLASMSFMLALETLGLSSTAINWPDFEPLELKMQKALNLNISDRVVMLISVGYSDPNGGIPFSQKKALNTLRNYNKIST